MVPRVIVRLALPFAVRRMHADLARTAFKDEPIMIEVLGNVLPAKDITQKCPSCIGIVRVDQCVDRGNHGVMPLRDHIKQSAQGIPKPGSIISASQVGAKVRSFW